MNIDCNFFLFAMIIFLIINFKIKNCKINLVKYYKNNFNYN